MKKLIELGRSIFKARKLTGSSDSWTVAYCTGFLNGFEMLSERMDGPNAPKTVGEVRVIMEVLFSEYAQKSLRTITTKDTK